MSVFGIVATAINPHSARVSASKDVVGDYVVYSFATSVDCIQVRTGGASGYAMVIQGDRVMRYRNEDYAFRALSTGRWTLKAPATKKAKK